jgi:hypothetical protein
MKTGSLFVLQNSLISLELFLNSDIGLICGIFMFFLSISLLILSCFNYLGIIRIFYLNYVLLHIVILYCATHESIGNKIIHNNFIICDKLNNCKCLGRVTKSYTIKNSLVKLLCRTTVSGVASSNYMLYNCFLKKKGIDSCNGK